MVRTSLLRSCLAWLAAAATLAAAPQAAGAAEIANIAFASWTGSSGTLSVQSNRVSFTLLPTPPIVDTLTAAVDSVGESASFTSSSCGGAPLMVPGASGSGTQVTTLRPSQTLRAGEVLYWRLAFAEGNRDPGALDSITLVLTGASGDREVVQSYETAPDSGVFEGGMPTRLSPPAAVVGDCRLSLRNGDQLSLDFGENMTAPIARAQVDVLADPFGLVFDSEDGTPVNGVRVSMVDALSGAPARVFADDGITPYPSSMLTGQPVSDAAGNVYPMLPGEYRFPLAPVGQYRLVVEPPAPYRAPSTASVAQLAVLQRPDGGPLHIGPASFGAALTLDGPTPVRVDIPVDRPGTAVTLTKSASRGVAMPGDVVFYAVTLRNDTRGAKRDVVLVDTPPRALRLRARSVRVDGLRDDAAVTIAPDGGQLTVRLGHMAPGEERRVTYAMAVRGDAASGQAVNRAQASDDRGNSAMTSAVVRIEREAIASTMTLIGRVTIGDCSSGRARPGLAGVRIVLEDGSFAVTDGDGRYHFEGLVPGTHVAQAQAATLPAGGRFVDCSRSSRSAGSASSRFVIGQGGSLQVADFVATVPQETAVNTEQQTEVSTDRAAAGGEENWFAKGNGPIDWLFPALDHNPRAPAVRVVIRHRVGQKVELSADGAPVQSYSFDGTRASPGGDFAVSVWRAIPIAGGTLRLAATVRDADGTVAANLARTVHFTATPAQVQIVPSASRLIADGATRPVLALRVLDRDGRPVHAGVSGEFRVNSPYESAQALDAMQSRLLSGVGTTTPQWTVKGDDGIAYVELAPTMVSGALRLDFEFADRDVRRRQQVEAWIVPGEQKWTLVGLAEGAAGSRNVRDAMERSGRFDSDLGKHARLAFYAKGRVLGRYLLTAAYDSAKQPEDQRLLGAIDPNAYYTVFADRSDRRFDAASREKLYVRIESARFYALFGDFNSGFDQTELGRYLRTATGVRAELRSGGFHAQGFAARIASTHRRDEIQGGGISGPYRLTSRAIIANSEVVSIEVRDRFRSELVVSRRTLSRFLDYDIDLLSGTIRFAEPVLSTDSGLNPQIIVIDYEVDTLAGGSVNAGLRADQTLAGGKLRLGGTVLSDVGAAGRTNLAALDIKAQLGVGTELRAEMAASRREGETSQAWLVELEHHDGRLDLLAYAREAEQDFGVGQNSLAERGRRKIGADARYSITESWSIAGSAWRDDSLTGAARRDAVQLRSERRGRTTDARLVLSSFTDHLDTGGTAASTVAEGGITRRFLDNRLELDASTSLPLGRTDSIDLPTRHRLSARYAISSAVRLLGSYELAEGNAVKARTARAGIELTPWRGNRVSGSIGQQGIAEHGKRVVAAFGVAQSLEITSRLSVDASLDSSRTVGGFDATRVINPAQPVSSGGNLGEAGTITEDFTALTLGGAWRDGRWSASARGELRKGSLADRKGFTFGAIRQLGEGAMVGSGVTWTRARAENGALSESLTAALSAAHRPDASPFAFLAKLEFRSDKVENAVAGEAGPAGRTALTVDGDAVARRLLASASFNWSPRARTADGGTRQRGEVALFLGSRYSFDRVEGFALAGWTLLAGLDARVNLGKRLEIGASATLRQSLADRTTSFAVGPQIGFVPAENTLLTLGYNVTGFRDRDFAASRSTGKGLFAAVRMKFDADSFRFLGLGA